MKNKPIVFPRTAWRSSGGCGFPLAKILKMFHTTKGFLMAVKLALILQLELDPGLSILHKSLHVNMFWRHISPVSFLISGPTALHIPAMVEGHREDIGSNHIASLMRNKG